MNYKQGEILLLPFPYTDLSSAKKRPALVVSNDGFNATSDDLICCLITTNPAKDKYSVQISQTDVEHGELRFESKVKPYRIFTVDKQIVVKKLCVLKAQKFNKVVSGLHKVTPKFSIF